MSGYLKGLLFAVASYSVLPNLCAQGPVQIMLQNWQGPIHWSPSPAEANQSRIEHQGQFRADVAQRSATTLTTPVLDFIGITPCRLVDTRGLTGESGAFGPPRMSPSEVRTFPILSNTRCAIPNTALAYSLNFTVVPAGPLAYLTAWPTPNRPSPEVSILNAQQGQVLANAAIIPAGTAGSIDIFVTNSTEVVIDINGYFVQSTTNVPAPLTLSAGLAAPTLSVLNTFSTSTQTDPKSASAAVTAIGFDAGGVGGYSGGRGIVAYGGTGGLGIGAGQQGGQGGIGLHATGGRGGNSGASEGGQGGAAIVAQGGDAADGPNIGGPGGRGMTVTGGTGGFANQGGVGIFVTGGAGGSGAGPGGIGLLAQGGSPGGSAALLVGNVSASANLSVTGTLSKGGGSFRIDHPLDPAHKYLSHSFVESPDMMNIYNGNIALDRSGTAWVELPEWFGALNRDFRYQLTPIGVSCPGLFIAEEVHNNRFKIAGGKPGARVSWTVTGVRHDRFANAYRIPVEENKPKEEQDFYLHPELFGQPKERSVIYVHHPELLQPASPRGDDSGQQVTEQRLVRPGQN